MKAKDLMEPVKASLKPGDGLQEFIDNVKTAMSCGMTCGVRSLPVLDQGDRPVGVLSMFDILKAVYPVYLYSTDLHLFTWDGMLESLAKEVAGKKVSDLMTKPVITVKEDHPLMECVDQMLKHRISTIPVVDKDDRVLGMLYESDIFFAIAERLTGGK
ncbi:MAG TPA: CBS domain-containing protein [Deltaproteobacteria bacterium]|nr:CBS domain-containing protein [Deltaproteobacteria bacterium]HOI07015.1 CBS domain-containing protein [Deltaproteobacteria bacterium]